MKIFPKAKSENIVVQDLKDEVLIYDLSSDKAFCLNETLKIVYQACDGQTTFDELKKKNEKLSDEVILLSLDRLDRAKLLTENFSINVPRRSLLIKAAASAIALPVIFNLVAPSSVSAQSACIANGSSCSLNNAAACCSTNCQINGGSPICDVRR